jgi:Putative Flp pilus-assembly TadE/G-like
MNAHREQGAVIVVVVLALTALLGMAALAIDTGLFSAHRRQLQTAADAAALAGAQQLISNPSLACATASRYARQNTDATSSTNLIKNANLDTSFCELLPTSGSSTPNSVAVRPVESSVPYLFGGVFGLSTANVNASARARIVYLTRTNGLLPFGVEDMEPTSVQVTVDSTGQQVPLGQTGCNAPTTEGYPYWCSGASITGLPAGGSTFSVTETDASGQTTTWNNIGYIGSDQSLSGCTDGSGHTCLVQDVVMSPTTNPALYYSSTSAPASFNVLAHLRNLPSNASVTISYNGNSGTATLVSGGTAANGIWTLPANLTTASSESSTGQAIQVSVSVPTGKGNKATTYGPVTVQHAYARDDGDLLQQVQTDRHYVDPSLAANAAGRFVNFNVAFQILVMGHTITLKLGGGGASGNSGNFQGLDLDTTAGSGACHGETSGIPNAADEVQYGACTPYSIGSPVQTQTGNFAGQVNNGLAARIGNSPDNWTGTSNLPAADDPRWMSLILVPPLTFSNCNGTCTTHVTGFGNFYITDWSGQPGSTLKQGEVQGVFWTRPNLINDYSTTCNDPSGVCLESVALMPWGDPQSP